MQLNPGRSARGQWRKLSAPIERLIMLGLLNPTQTVFDYGCGQGLDILYLRQRGFQVEGWDPNWRPEGQIKPADVVILNFVVDCIADPAERTEALQRAWSLAGDYMMVTVRRDRSLRRIRRYSDGWMTHWPTFQRLFSQAEFYEFLVTALPGMDPMEFERGGCALIAKDDYWHKRIRPHTSRVRCLHHEPTGNATASLWQPIAKRCVRGTTQLRGVTT